MWTRLSVRTYWHTFASLKWRAHSCVGVMIKVILRTLCLAAMKLVNHSINMAGTSGPTWHLRFWILRRWYSACVCVCARAARGYKYMPPQRPPVFALASLPTQADRSARGPAAIKQMCWRIALDQCVCVRVCVCVCVQARLIQSQCERSWSGRNIWSHFAFIHLFIIVSCTVKLLTFLLLQQETNNSREWRDDFEGLPNLDHLWHLSDSASSLWLPCVT